jgi:hypothetical protein
VNDDGGDTLNFENFEGGPGYSLFGSAPAGTWSVTSTPLPAALPLVTTGLGMMGLFGWRRKRKNAAAVVAAYLPPLIAC